MDEAQTKALPPAPVRTGPLRPKVVRRTQSLVGRTARQAPVLKHYPFAKVRASLAARRLRADFEQVRSYVMFVGHPRSGHSLVGALLDAHPDAIVAHELDALKYLEAGFDRDQLYAMLVTHQRERVAGGMKSSWGYTYAVPTGWQGRYRTLQVIGDKKGGRSTARLAEQPGLLDQLTATVGVPVRIIHVVRNPLDNIATMHRWAGRPLEDHVDSYFERAATVTWVQQQVPPECFHELTLEDLTADPATALTDLVRFLGLAAWGEHLETVASVVFPSARRTRDTAPWTPELQRRVAEESAAHPALARYGLQG